MSPELWRTFRPPRNWRTVCLWNAMARATVSTIALKLLLTKQKGVRKIWNIFFQEISMLYVIEIELSFRSVFITVYPKGIKTITFSEMLPVHFSLAALLSYPPLSRSLEVWSDQPGLELYTGTGCSRKKNNFHHSRQPIPCQDEGNSQQQPSTMLAKAILQWSFFQFQRKTTHLLNHAIHTSTYSYVT